jgi:hypothetical protein
MLRKIIVGLIPHRGGNSSALHERNSHRRRCHEGLWLAHYFRMRSALQRHVAARRRLAAGDYLISGPVWKGNVPQGMTQISSPNNLVLVIGRVLVESEGDLATAYGLAKQIQLSPLSQK